MEPLNHKDIIGDIYEASYRPEHWDEVLRGVADITKSRSATMIYRDNELEKANGIYLYNYDAEAAREYNDYYGQLDPFFRLCAEAVPTGIAAADHQMVPDRQELEGICGTFYSEYMVRYDVNHVCGAHIFNDPKQSAAISVQRGKAAGPWSDELIQHITDLVPHFQRALNIHKEFTRLRMRETALHAGLDRLLIGLILFDEFMQPVYSNPVAESILKQHPALRMQHDQIYAEKVEDTEKIRRGLTKALSFNTDKTLEYSTAMGLRHSDSTMPLPILITPIHSAGLGLQHGDFNAHAALFVSDPESNQLIMSDALREAYDLTQAESEIAISIANGLSVDEIADIRGSTNNTVRGQLKLLLPSLG